jgi:L,D-transpeptidase ErfK/SrfK
MKLSFVKKITVFRSVIALMALAVSVGGCSIFDAPVRPESAAKVAPPPPAKRPRLEPINRNYFALESPEQSVVGQPQLVFATEENTFSDIAREYGLGYDELVAANPHVDPWIPGDGTPILLPTQFVIPNVTREGIVLNVASRRLFYFPKIAEGETPYVITYPIGIGRVGWDTPLGGAEVISKARDPVWYVPASVRKEHAEAGDPLPAVVPAGPDNPLGKFVLKLDMPGYLIHGTNQPYGVGMRVSHGCVRLYPENIELLYELVGIGEKVTIINEPYLAGWSGGELYFESHAPLEDDEVAPEEHLQRVFTAVRNRSGAFNEETEQDQARAIASSASGVPVRVLKGDSAEVLERARIVRNTVELDADMPTLAEVRGLIEAELIEAELEGDDAEKPLEPAPVVEQALNDE